MLLEVATTIKPIVLIALLQLQGTQTDNFKTVIEVSQQYASKAECYSAAAQKIQNFNQSSLNYKVVDINCVPYDFLSKYRESQKKLLSSKNIIRL